MLQLDYVSKAELPQMPVLWNTYNKVSASEQKLRVNPCQKDFAQRLDALKTQLQHQRIPRHWYGYGILSSPTR